jgi:hypothetical protein
LILVAVYFLQKPASAPELDELPPPPNPRGLFPEPENLAQLEADTRAGEVRAEVLAEAEAGDKSALRKAHGLSDNALYDQALTTLVTLIKSDAELLSLISHVTRNEWPVNKSLALACIDSWAKAPDKSSTTKTLHIAALSDDADTFGTAVELAMKFWREGKVSDLTAIELNALLNGEFWVLSSATRGSGAGFVLKRTLASARRELEGTKTNN